MEKNEVWDICNIREKPEYQRLLGTKWVFKVKKNGVLEARLVAQAFAQITCIDHQDNFSSVIYDKTLLCGQCMDGRQKL